MSLAQRILGAGKPDHPNPEQINLGIEPHVAIEVLRNERRQRVLHELTSSESGRLNTSELADRLGAHEEGVPVGHASSKQRKAVYIGLYQHHLPKLSDVGLIEYEQERGVAEITSDADGVVECMQVLDLMLDGGGDE